MICDYCRTYYESEIRKYSERFCKLTAKMVTSDQEGCEDFTLNHLFWCKKTDQWMDVVACQHRKKEGKEGCVYCKQGKLFLVKPKRKISRKEEV